MAELQEKFHGWRSALESKGLKVNLIKTKVMVSKIGQITVRPSSKKTHVAFVVEKQCIMQYYVNFVKI